MAVMFQIICIMPAIEDKIRNFKYTGSSFKKKNSLFFNNFKAFIIQILYLVYLLDCSGGIVEENMYYRCKTVVLQTISGIGLFLGSRL